MIVDLGAMGCGRVRGSKRVTFAYIYIYRFARQCVSRNVIMIAYMLVR